MLNTINKAELVVLLIALRPSQGPYSWHGMGSSFSTCIIGRKHGFARTHCDSKQVSPHSQVKKVDPALLLCAAMPDRYRFSRKLVPALLQRLTTLWSPVYQHTQRSTRPNTPDKRYVCTSRDPQYCLRPWEHVESRLYTNAMNNCAAFSLESLFTVAMQHYANF